MKRRLIQRKEDLPDAFNLKKYETANNFNIAEWAINLEMRVLCKHQLSSSHHESKLYGIKLVNDLLQNPIFETGPIPSGTGLKKVVFPSQINDLDVNSYFCAAINFKEARYKKYADAVHKNMETSEQLTEIEEEIVWSPVWKMYQDIGIDGENNRYVVIDLHGSEEKIIDDVRQWLREARLQAGLHLPQKKFSKKDFAEWTNKGILPFLDLENWATAAEVQISHNLLGLTLFPHEYEVELTGRIRKGTIPLARSITHEGFTDALRSQALAEFADSQAATMGRN
ncbi:MAG: DUF6387 family protein [Pseudomonadota bacterium]